MLKRWTGDCWIAVNGKNMRSGIGDDTVDVSQDQLDKMAADIAAKFVDVPVVDVPVVDVQPSDISPSIVEPIEVIEVIEKPEVVPEEPKKKGRRK